MVKNPPANAGDFGLIPGPGISPGEGNGYPFQCQLQTDTCQEHYQQPNNRDICLCGNCVFPDSSVGKRSACNAGEPSLIPGLGRSPGEGKGYPLQYSGLENSMHRIVHGAAKSWTWLSDFQFTSLGFPNVHSKRILFLKVLPQKKGLWMKISLGNLDYRKTDSLLNQV